MGTFYEHFESENVRLLSRYPDDVKSKVEKSITKQVKENMKKNKTNFLNVADLLDIKEIKKYFDAILINGPRAIGKSYSVKHFLLKRFRDHGERFGWIRNTQEQAVKNLKNDGMFWGDFGYEISISNRAVVSLHDKDKAVNDKNIKDTAGWYIGLSTGKSSKSIDYPGVKWIHFEEYNDGTKNKNQLADFASLASTIFRLRTDGFVIMSSNMISQSNPFFTSIFLVLIFRYISYNYPHLSVKGQ